MLNQYLRYQKGLTLQELFPIRNDGTCACGCERKLIGRSKRWYSKECQEKALTTFLVVKGDNSFIRKQLFIRDKGICSCCGKQMPWHADHILPVFQGGGACDLDNLQTLCTDCHHQKTIYERIKLNNWPAKCNFVTR